MAAVINTPTAPTIFDGADIAYLKVRGASYKTIQMPHGLLSVPTHLILGYKTRRWTLTVTEVVETYPNGDPIEYGPGGFPKGHWAACSCPTCTERRNRSQTPSSPPTSIPAKPQRGCPKCGDPGVQQLPDPTEPEAYSVIKCPACGWSTRCSSPAPAAPDHKGGA